MIVRASTFWELPWFIDRTGYDVPPGFRGLVAVGDDGRIRGLVGFDRWTPASACMHVAVDNPAACRSLLRASFRYLFQDTGRVLARAEVRAGNSPSMEATRRVGFREVFRTKDGWAEGEDLVHFEMRREECRWLDADPGKVARKTDDEVLRTVTTNRKPVPVPPIGAGTGNH